ncbi:MAG: type II and III secretion system protein [Acidobacteriota bacterium]|nr:type II and III secretion system protein [Acidobacteriota bacterium]
MPSRESRKRAGTGAVTRRRPQTAGKSIACALLLLLATTPGVGAVAAPPEDAPSQETVLDTVEFKQARIQDVVRTISELTGVNIVATSEAGRKEVTLFVRNASVAEIVDSVCRIASLWYRYNPETGVFIVMTAEEYQKDIVVYRDELVRIFQLQYLNVGVAARVVADLFGDRVELLGRANRHLGDDFRISSSDADSESVFEDDYDEGDMEGGSGYGGYNGSSGGYGSSGRRRSRSSSSYSRDSRYGSRSQRGDEIQGLRDEKLTPEQIARLEASTAGSQMVAEGTVGRIVQRGESATIYVTVNRPHNLLLVRTSDEKAMAEIEKIIKASDRQTPEVLLEMKVLEVRLTDEFQSAFDISGLTGATQTGPADGQPANPLDTSSSSSRTAVLGLGNGTLQGGSMIFQVLSGNLRARMQLLERENNVRMLATPMLLAANNHPARLFIGEETVITTGFETQGQGGGVDGAYMVVNSIPVPVTEVRSLGNTLSILPSINADRSVVMRIVHENSTIHPGGGSIPMPIGSRLENVAVDTVDTSRLEGTVLAMDGMTVAVGGMMRTTSSNDKSKVPVLGDVPLFGFLFRDQTKSEVKTELVLLITPHVISAPDQGEDVTRRSLTGLRETMLQHPYELDIYIDKQGQGGEGR